MAHQQPRPLVRPPRLLPPVARTWPGPTRPRAACRPHRSTGLGGAHRWTMEPPLLDVLRGSPRWPPLHVGTPPDAPSQHQRPNGQPDWMASAPAGYELARGELRPASDEGRIRPPQRPSHQALSSSRRMVPSSRSACGRSPYARHPSYRQPRPAPRRAMRKLPPEARFPHRPSAQHPPVRSRHLGPVASRWSHPAQRQCPSPRER